MTTSDPVSWSAVDDYLGTLLRASDPALEAAVAASAAAGLPSIAVSPILGRLLRFLAELVGARRILEIGTLGGYSTICLARALPDDGRLVSLELEPLHARVAEENLARAGVQGRVEIRVGRAIESLGAMIAEGVEPFDLVFIDADKAGYAAYLDLAIELVRPGALIIADNVVRKGHVVDEASADVNVRGVRSFLERCAAHPRLSFVAFQTVGAKGHDGIALVRVTDKISRA